MDDCPQPVFGLDIPLDECDWIAFSVIPNKLLSEENYLFTTKWFDYRSMHLVHATYLFAEAYRTAYRELFARNFDRTRAEHVKGMKGLDIFDSSKKRGGDMTGFVKARQYADLMGMPYIEYARIAMTWLMRRSREHMPRPCHLYAYDLLTAIQETWRERQAAQVFVAEDPLFKNEAYQGLPVQDAHHEWLLQQASIRANPDHFLANVVYSHEALPEGKVATRFGDEKLERIRLLK